MLNNTYPNNWKICGTCSYWSGKQVPDSQLVSVKVNDNERAKCVKSGGCEKLPHQTCSQWQQRFKK